MTGFGQTFFSRAGRGLFTLALAVCVAGCSFPALLLAGCDGQSAASGDGTTEGPAYTPPASVTGAEFNAGAAVAANGGMIDISSVGSGYVAVAATNASRLKFQVINGAMSYNYDLPNTGVPLVCPLNMGDGYYSFRIMQNTSGNNYVEITSTGCSVAMASEFEPYVRPNVFCNYSEGSASVAQARQLAAGAQNQGDVLRAVYSWITENISYDQAKAAQLANATGYVPNPDATLQSRSGICFDYVSLAAAMLRSLGIPCRIVTGYVSPNGIYHAWNLVYLDGSWTSAHISVSANTWTRIDLTFAAAGGTTSYAGDGASYTDRFTY